MSRGTAIWPSLSAPDSPAPDPCDWFPPRPEGPGSGGISSFGVRSENCRPAKGDSDGASGGTGRAGAPASTPGSTGRAATAGGAGSTGAGAGAGGASGTGSGGGGAAGSGARATVGGGGEAGAGGDGGGSGSLATLGGGGAGGLGAGAGRAAGGVGRAMLPLDGGVSGRTRGGPGSAGGAPRSGARGTAEAFARTPSSPRPGCPAPPRCAGRPTPRPGGRASGGGGAARNGRANAARPWDHWPLCHRWRALRASLAEEASRAGRVRARTAPVTRSSLTIHAHRLTFLVTSQGRERGHPQRSRPPPALLTTSRARYGTISLPERRFHRRVRALLYFTRRPPSGSSKEETMRVLLPSVVGRLAPATAALALGMLLGLPAPTGPTAAAFSTPASTPTGAASSTATCESSGPTSGAAAGRPASRSRSGRQAAPRGPGTTPRPWVASRASSRSVAP